MKCLNELDTRIVDIIVYIFTGNLTMNGGTLLQRRKKTIRFSKAEVLLILRAYREHPTRWSDVLDDVRQNIEQLPDLARDLYRNGTDKQLKDRMSLKLGKLMTSHDRIEDGDIRQEIELVRAQERRLVAPNPLPIPRALNAVNIDPNPQQVVDLDLQQDQLQNELDQDAQEEPELNPRDQPANQIQRQPRAAERRDAIAAELPDVEDEPPAQRRRLADIVRENHELYNNFMRNTMPRILEQFGVDLI